MEEDRESPLVVAVRFSCGREISPKLAEIKFDKYRITTLPSKKDFLRPSGEEALLEFLDVWGEGQTASNPEQEAQYVLAWLSVLFGARVDFDSAKVANVNVTRERRERRRKQTPFETDSRLNSLFHGLCALDEKGARQYLRACEAYRVAVSVLDDNPTLAMFMLVTSVKCLSNTFATGSGYFDRFRDFIFSYLPAELESERADPKFPELLRRCYDFRSGFTLPQASLGSRTSYALSSQSS
jgi:hypothetical protein